MELSHSVFKKDCKPRLCAHQIIFLFNAQLQYIFTLIINKICNELWNASTYNKISNHEYYLDHAGPFFFQSYPESKYAMTIVH